MKQLTPNEILYLIDENCPQCNATVNYDDATKEYYCPCCGKAWNYGFTQDCIKAFKADPQKYLNNIDKSNLP